MADDFHERHGRLVYLSNGNRTARRRNPGVEFNNGLIFSKSTLKENQLFEIRIDRKIGCWSGSLAIGVTTANPSNIEIPSSASGLKNGYWILSGVAVIKDGVTLLENYGRDLDELTEGDRVGVRRDSDGCLHFYVNGNDFGVACTDVPSNLYAVIDLYGKCVEISSYQPFKVENAQATQINVPSTVTVAFHPHCGSLVKLCNHNRTAERQNPNEEFKNSVVLTNCSLENDKLFEVRVEALTEIWAGSLEVGVTTHNPVDIVLPATMTMMPTGTWIWSASSIINNGKEIKNNYSEISLEAIKVGDKVGIMRKSDNTLHFFLNGVDLGVAVAEVPEVVYGVIDLYGAAIRATVCSDDLNDGNEASNVSVETPSENITENALVPLCFHSRCGMAVSLINNNCTALRPRALEEFNYAVVLTDRPLNPGELFEVYIDRQVDKWAGSLEIGLTTHNPDTLEFPSTMTNVQSGTWIMSGGGLVINGATVMEDYGNNLDDLKVGDRVGVRYSESGSLHFFVNGEDMGEAASDVPSGVYGIVDLYGRSAQATITNGQPREEIPESPATSTTTNQEPVAEQAQHSVLTPPVTNENWFTFSARHGDQVAISQDHRDALRINPLVEFNNAVVMSNRPLRNDEMFEVIVLTLVDRWSGSLEAGVTTISPTQLNFPNTMTDLDHDTWMLSGSSVLQDGITIQNGYACDLDKLMESHRLGIMRKSDGTLHFFINGEDCGVAASSVPPDIYAIIDLYGRCVQLAIYDEDYISRTTTAEVTTETQATTTAVDYEKDQTSVPSSFHRCCGRNITLVNKCWIANRTKGFSNGLLFSSKPLQDDEIFEIKVDKVGTQWSGSLGVGVTSCLLPMSNVPSSADQLRDGTWLMVESRILKDGMTVKENYGSSLDRLQVGTRIGVQRRRDGTLHIYINGEDQGVAATDVPRMVFGLVDLYGVVESVSIVRQTDQRSSSPRSNVESDRTLESKGSQKSEGNESTQKTRHTFKSICGQHVRLDNKRMLARRVASYNHGVVLSDSPLPDNELFQIRITKLDIRWSGSLMIGITDQEPDSLSLPSISNCMKICNWIVVNNAVYINGNKVFEGLQPGLDRLHVGDSVGLMVDKDSRLHIVINGQDQGAVAEALPAKRHVVVDLYGCCQEVSIVTTADQEHTRCEAKDEDKTPKSIEEQKKDPCDFRQLCDRFRASLAIPDGYFSHESKLNICYCQACHEARGEKQYEVSGDPARRYAQPLGWCQFGLGLPPRVKSLQVLEKWHVAFYGTQIGKIRRILDVGDLPMPASGPGYGRILMLGEEVRSGSRRTKSNSNKENDIPRLMISPTVMCVTCSKQAPSHQNGRKPLDCLPVVYLTIRPRRRMDYEYRDVATGKTYSAQVAFRVCVRPGCYDTGQASSRCTDTNEALSDHNLGTQDLEWYLSEKGLVVLTSLLIKIEPT